MCNFYYKQNTDGWYHLLTMEIFHERWAFWKTELQENSWILQIKNACLFKSFFSFQEKSTVKTMFGQMLFGQEMD